MSNLFRKKSMEQITSPEQLNAYIRVSTPSVWLVLAAVIVLLTGVCVWGFLGYMDTTLTTAVLSQDGAAVAYIKEDDVLKVPVGTAVTVGDAKGTILSVSAEPVRVDATFTDYLCHVGGLQQGEWVYLLTLDAACPDGVHAARIIVDSVSPMSFVLN